VLTRALVASLIICYLIEQTSLDECKVEFGDKL
jgi:hypothetical protein